MRKFGPKLQPDQIPTCLRNRLGDVLGLQTESPIPCTSVAGIGQEGGSWHSTKSQRNSEKRKGVFL